MLSEHDFERCSYEAEGAKSLLDEQLAVIQYPVAISAASPLALQNIDQLDPGPGVMLIQSPFEPDIYEDAATAPERFALDKYIIFSELCQRLGAKAVVVNHVKVERQQDTLSTKVSGERPIGSIEGNIDRELTRKFSEQMTMTLKFSGSSADIAGAQQLLQSRNLTRDSCMSSLIEMRKEGPNQLMSRKLVINLSSETKKNLSIAARITVPGFVSLGIDYKTTSSRQLDYVVTLDVQF